MNFGIPYFPSMELVILVIVSYAVGLVTGVVIARRP